MPVLQALVRLVYIKSSHLCVILLCYYSVKNKGLFTMALLHADYSLKDFDEVARNIGLKPEHWPMIIKLFHDESSKIITMLQEAIESKNYEDIKLHAHSIKGSAGNLQFKEISKMAEDIESASENRDTDFQYNTHVESIKKLILTIPL